MTNLLYLSSCHPTLETDDLKLLSRAGANCFTTGLLLDPSCEVTSAHLNLRDSLTSPLRYTPDQDLLLRFRELNPNYEKGYRGLDIPNPKLSREFVDKFDAVVVVHIEAMKRNWDVIKHKPIILKTCGNTYKQEAELKVYADQSHMTFVRGSKNEFNMVNANPGHVIRISIDPDIYSGWTGTEKTLLTFHSHFKERRDFPPVQNFLKIIPEFNTEIYGAFSSGNKDPLVRGTLSGAQQLERYKKCAVYFGISSGRAPITYNFLEASITGIPVVTYGPKIGSSVSTLMGYPELCEVPELIENGVTGFYSDDVVELKHFIRQLMSERELSETISKNAREKLLKEFHPDVVVKNWKTLFKILGL